MVSIEDEAEDVSSCAITGGDVTFLGIGGLLCIDDLDCLCKLPEEVVDLNGGVFVPIFASPATLSLATAANDLLLLLVFQPADDPEY